MAKALSSSLKNDIQAEKMLTNSSIKLNFQVHFHTQFGQTLYITGNHQLLGNNDFEKALPLTYQDNNLWLISLSVKGFEAIVQPIIYNYLLKNIDGSFIEDWGNDKKFIPANFTTNEVTFIDAWNHAGYYENAFYTVPFQNVLLSSNHTLVKIISPKKITHTFKVKAPLLSKGQTLCMLGNANALSNWQSENSVFMSRAENDVYFQVNLNLTDAIFPIIYKYGVYDVVQKLFLNFEGGDNRLLFDAPEKNKQTIVNDGFVFLQNNQWKGAGVAIPVFSLKSQNSFGVGEFADMNLLVDWAKKQV